jgi:hypothetical protein
VGGHVRRFVRGAPVIKKKKKKKKEKNKKTKKRTSKKKKNKNKKIGLKMAGPPWKKPH